MPSTRAKGMSAEKEIAAAYRAEGYLVIRPNWSRFQPLDFFGLFDFIAVHKDKGWVLGRSKVATETFLQLSKR